MTLSTGTSGNGRMNEWMNGFPPRRIVLILLQVMKPGVDNPLASIFWCTLPGCLIEVLGAQAIAVRWQAQEGVAVQKITTCLQCFFVKSSNYYTASHVWVKLQAPQLHDLNFLPFEATGSPLCIFPLSVSTKRCLTLCKHMRTNRVKNEKVRRLNRCWKLG